MANFRHTYIAIRYIGIPMTISMILPLLIALIVETHPIKQNNNTILRASDLVGLFVMTHLIYIQYGVMIT